MTLGLNLNSTPNPNPTLSQAEVLYPLPPDLCVAFRAKFDDKDALVAPASLGKQRTIMPAVHGHTASRNRLSTLRKM